MSTELLPTDALRNRLILFGVFVALLALTHIFRRRILVGGEPQEHGWKAILVCAVAFPQVWFVIYLARGFSAYMFEPAPTSGVNLGEVLTVLAITFSGLLLVWISFEMGKRRGRMTAPDDQRR